MSAAGTFDVTLTSAAAELGGVVARHDLRKIFHCDLGGTGAGVTVLHYEIVPGSGRVDLTIEAVGTYRFVLTYEL